MSATPSAPFLASLAAIAFVSPLAVHAYFPVVPEVQKALGISSTEAGLTLSIALFVMAFTTLVSGALSDRYGRRRVLLLGLALFCAGSMWSSLASSTVTLIVGRVLQAIGAGAASSLNRAIAHDAYGPEKLVKVLAYLAMAYAVAPMVAPYLSALTIERFGWRSTFWLSGALGAIIGIASWRVLYETRPAHTRIRGLATMLTEYVHLMRQPRFAAFVIQPGASTATFLALASSAAFVMRDYLGLPPSDFARYFVLCPLGLFTGNFVATRLSGRVRAETMVLTGTLTMATALSAQAVMLLADFVGPLQIFIPGFLLTFAQGLSMPNAQSAAMRLAPGAVGTAAGIGVFFQMFLGALAAELFAVLNDGTPRAMVIAVMSGVAVTFTAGVTAFVLTRRARRSGDL